jgi:hypothetical protein
MSNKATWDSPISEEQQKRFIVEAQTKLEAENVNIEEVTLSYRVDFAVGDRANAAGSPFEAKVLERAAALADKTSINARTQDPILDGTSRLPGDMMICLFGVAARAQLGTAAAATSAINQLAIGQGLDEMMLVCKQGALRRFELPLDECLSVGQGQQRYGLAVDTDETNVPVKDRGWRKLKPCVLGKDQQLTLSLFTSRTTDWPAAFSVRLMFPSLIARVK